MELVNAPTKFEARSFTRSWDNRGYLKTVGNPWLCPRSLSSKVLMGFVWMDPVNVPANFKVRSFTNSWDNSGYLKTTGRYLTCRLCRRYWRDWCSHVTDLICATRTTSVSTSRLTGPVTRPRPHRQATYSGTTTLGIASCGNHSKKSATIEQATDKPIHFASTSVTASCS